MFSDQLVDQLSQLIIRPHRQVYGLDKLGPKKIILKSTNLGNYIEIYRHQCTILSSGKKIQLSIFQPHQKLSASTQILNLPLSHDKSCKIPIQSSLCSENKTQLTIFLHTNSGSRLEGVQYCKFLLQHGHIVCLFDYSGSGVSEGEYVTMGMNESVDLANVVQYLKQNFYIEKVNLWGRSMGAVTAVLYSARYPKNVRKMVLDSPFCDFRQLVKEIVNTRTGLPQFLFGLILNRIEQHLQKKLSVNMMDIDLKNQIIRPGMQKIPIFFLLSKDDKLVRPVHVQTLYQMHKGYKKIVYLQGSHNKSRPTQIREQCAQFLSNKLYNISSQKIIEIQKKQNINSLCRKYSQDTTSTDPKQKISSSSFILNYHQNASHHQQHHINIQHQFKINNQTFFTNLLRKNKPDPQLPSTLSTPRDDHSLNKYSSSKISLSQLKKSQTTNAQTNLNMKHSQIGSGKDFKKQSKTTMAIQYKNKLKNHINRI